jgi:proline racemase/trans-L-3-hydroxyproline dehydratase
MINFSQSIQTIDPHTITLGNEIKKAANEQFNFQHPLKPEINTIDLIEFSLKSKKKDVDYRNTVIFGNGQVNRSPCGTGTCAKMAVLFKQGKMNIGDTFVHESIIDSQFTGRIAGLSKVGDSQAIIPQISGAAWITGIHQFIIDCEDIL